MINPLGSLGLTGGYRIIESSHMVDKIQIKTHRKRRINKKWAKRYGFKTVPKKDAVILGSAVIVHPLMARALREKIRKTEELR